MEEVFREDAYAGTCSAKIISSGPEGIILDRTVFYPMGGGQPGDTGTLKSPDGSVTHIADTRKSQDGTGIIHVPVDGDPLPAVGSTIEAEIDWDRRYRHMRMHTTLHLLCSLVEGDVTGGQIGADKSRLDFNIPAGTVDKVELTERLNALIVADHAVSARWVSEEELTSRDDLVRTMSVKPPMGSGSVRLLDVQGVDLQACGGTHVARTGEIGPVEVSKIENKGKQNRRINVVLKPA